MEVYKWVHREEGEPAADAVTARMLLSEVVPLDAPTAMRAARLTNYHAQLVTADAIILATARQRGCELVTLDHHFKDLPGVTYLPKGGRR